LGITAHVYVLPKAHASRIFFFLELNYLQERQAYSYIGPAQWIWVKKRPPTAEANAIGILGTGQIARQICITSLHRCKHCSGGPGRGGALACRGGAGAARRGGAPAAGERARRGGGAPAATLPRRGGVGPARRRSRSRRREAALPRRRGAGAARRSSRGGAPGARRSAAHLAASSEVPAQAPDPWRRWPLRLEPASSSAGREAAGARQGERPPAGSGRDGREGRRRCTDGGTGRRRGGESEERGATFGRLLENTMFGFRTSLLCSTQKM